ncbi:MAG: ABC transporter ATP-binding protein/permease [Desulfobacteraceae bacterium]|nr:MAG: ABC transporter ATP-binding protein/permease [Desulfobacteraceae bacterium]
MHSGKSLINRQTWGRFIQFVKLFATSEEVGGKAKWFFAALVALLLGINGLNVLNSYVNRDFMTAIENRQMAGFLRMACIYVGVFGAITLVSVFYTYTERSLGLLWREWATRQSMLGYADHRVYYRLKAAGELDNPDQRIAEDIRAFTTTTISFVLILLNSALTVIAFSGVLWSISPMLFIAAVFYAAGGSFLTYKIGRPLVRLNFDQLDREANLRSSLIHLRANAESVALCRRETRLIRILLRNLGDLTENFRRIIATSRNVEFFTTGYNWMIQIIPALIIAPLFIKGKVQFGVITQSAIAFTHLLGAFSLIVTQFQSISSFTAVLARLSSLMDAMESSGAPKWDETHGSADDAQVAYKGLTLRSPTSGRALIRDLSFTIKHGESVLVCGPEDESRTALFRATAGLWEVSQGHITRPKLEQILFVTERPYLPRGAFRELFMRPWAEDGHPDERAPEEFQFPELAIRKALREVGIEEIPKRFGGMDSPQTWESALTLAEQQLVVIARVLVAEPPFVFLDKPRSTLSPEQILWVLGLFKERLIGAVVFEESGFDKESYDKVLQIEKTGYWSTLPLVGGRAANEDQGVAV